MRGTAPASQRANMAKWPVISIVDDDFSVREAAFDLMRSLGFAAEAFVSAEDFLASDARYNTSCLIADVRLPGMDGLQLHHRLQASGIIVPMILMTAYPNEKIRARALKAGVISYLVKPFDVDELIAGIDGALASRKAS